MSREPIRKLPPDKRGRVRWRAVVDVGKHPASGKRQQLTYTCDTAREARDWYTDRRTEVRRGTFVHPEVVTVAGYVAGWLGGRRDLKPATVENYRNALRPVVATVGAKPVQQLTKADLDAMVAGMLDGRLRSVGEAGRPLSGRSVRLTLAIVSQALDSAVREGRLARNVATLVERPRQASTSRRHVWELGDVSRFLTVADADRLAGAWRLSLHGLRRGEVLGLTWADVDADAAAVTVHRSRVVVGGRSVLQDTTRRRPVSGSYPCRTTRQPRCAAPVPARRRNGSPPAPRTPTPASWRWTSWGVR